MALYDVPDGEHLLAKAALDRALAEHAADDPAELVVHLGPSTLRRAVWALPTIDAALARFDRADVTWSASPIVRSLLEGHLAARRRGRRPLLAKAGGRTPSPRGGPRVELWLADGEPSPGPALSSAASGASGASAPTLSSGPARSPSGGPDARPFALRVRPAFRFGDGIHVAARWARGASNAGLPGAGQRPVLAVPSFARKHAQGLAYALAGRWDRPLVALLPGRRPRRRWGAGPMGEFARALAHRLGARVFVWPPEPIDGGVSPATTLPPTSAAALLSLCALCVGDDDGWAHVAAAVGAPTLTLHGPTCPERFGPASALGAALGAPPCRTGTHGPGRARRCLSCLQPADPLGLAERLASERWPHDIVARWR